MIKAGLIIGIIALILGAGASLLTPLCVPCLAVFLGAIAGYLAAMWEAAPDKVTVPNAGDATKSGAIAGVISGIGGLLGQWIGGFINAQLVDPQQAMRIARDLGFEMPNLDAPGAMQGYWVGVIGANVCFGILDIVIMAGLGAIGGILWWNLSGKKRPLTPPTDLSP